MKKLKIGICGWGNVATGLFNTLKYNNERITSNGNLEIEIVVIGARRDNPKCNPGDIKIERDIESKDEIVQNTTTFIVDKNRPFAKLGYAGTVYYNPDTTILTEEVVIGREEAA